MCVDLLSKKPFGHVIKGPRFDAVGLSQCLNRPLGVPFIETLQSDDQIRTGV